MVRLESESPEVGSNCFLKLALIFQRYTEVGEPAGWSGFMAIALLNIWTACSRRPL